MSKMKEMFIHCINDKATGYSEPFKQMLLRYIAANIADMHAVVILPRRVRGEHDTDARVVFERYMVDGKSQCKRFIMPLPETVQ